MARVICRNTFLDVISGEDACGEKSHEHAPLHQIGRRSRSADSFRCDPREESSDEATDLQILRLNRLLGLDPAGLLPLADGSATVPQRLHEKADAASLSGLMLLQERLRQALVPTGSLSKLRSIMSNASISTMCPASEDAGDNIDHSESDSESVRFNLNVEEYLALSTPQTPQSPPTPPMQFAQQPLGIAKAGLGMDAHFGQTCARQAHQHTHSSSPPVHLRVHEAVQAQSSPSKVPRNVNLLEENERLGNSGSLPTTLMLRSIPNRYTQRELIVELEEMGFVDSFDFLYVPMDKCTRGNLGYAFVNFVDPSWAQKCLAVFQNYRCKRHRDVSSKISTVSVAHLQGLENNVAHYSNAAVSSSRHKQRRPVVLRKNMDKFAAGSKDEFADLARATTQP